MVEETSAPDYAAYADTNRLKLFSFTIAEKRAEYLWVLRAFDHARANYTFLLHAGAVAHILEKLGGSDAAADLSAAEVTPLLAQLHVWEILEVIYDSTRAAPVGHSRNTQY